MELQLGKQEHRMYTRVFDRTEEETCSVDAVVPDALGDLSALVVTEGTFCLWNLAFSDKSAQIEGCIAADVVYAEENGALRSFPVELPVKVHMSGETLAEDIRPWLRCTLAALDARAVNSRKVRVTARLSLCLRAYRETELALTERIESDSGAVFTHSEPLCVHVPVAVEEQTFTATQMHRFTAGQPETDRLLCHTESVLLDEVQDRNHPSETVTWLYETDYEFLNSPNIKKIIVGGHMYLNHKLRLLLAGIDESRIVCVEDEADIVDHVDRSGIEKVYVLFEIDYVTKARNMRDRIVERAKEEAAK